MNTLKSNDQNEKEIKTRPWTEKDKIDLKELYPYKTDKELCIILEKTSGQLRGMKERLKLNQKNIPFSDIEKEKIIDFYENNCKYISLDDFSKEIGRSKTSIQRYAKKIGLNRAINGMSEKSKERLSNSLLEYRKTDNYINNTKKEQIELLTYYAKNKHPRGMLNKHHSEETKKKLSKSHKILFSNMSYEEKHERAMKSVITKRKYGGFKTTCNSYSRCKGGYRNDLNQYFRSAWEANIARLLNYYNIEWIYESKRFNFDKEYHKVISYQPDFYLPKYDIWIEVKGWMDDKSKKRLELFEKYFPCEFKKLYLIDEKVYNILSHIYSSLIENWEYKGKYFKKQKVVI